MSSRFPVSRCAVLAMLSLLMACTKHKSVTENATKQIQSGATEVNIGQVGDFLWDSMFAFGPYYAKDGVCRTLKLADSECLTAGIRDIDEGEFFLVFMQNGRVSRVESFPRTVGNFDEACLAKEIPRAKAQFKVERKAVLYLMCR